ncbi:L-fucose/L-arabinose isomerase family protein [Candidatus Caldatribacterium sp.]|uniref:L-fucose/L-arabinose isomerase family protein n=1 Tax=Candidatus Caldatribacterium sp. TaxID=2282143 RepID=UPI00299600C7|nr:L-fucose/L-arabinose isomerase family protein [Candidatus Caldatribacterium sp.]MDW8080937.1 L-fucose/L-arabinose isomerase family protein [Candidatus Calescibacterium sp.]
MIRLGLLTFSDSRSTAYQAMLPVNLEFQRKLEEALKSTNEVEVLVGRSVIQTPKQAEAEVASLEAMGVDGFLFHFAGWSFPHLATVAARRAQVPILLFASFNPGYPSLIGMIASGASLDQIGVHHGRVWGDPSCPECMARILQFGRAARAVHRLRGQVCGLLGGRSMGMYVGTADPAQWQSLFGVDLEHVDQLEIVRRAKEVPQEQVDRAFRWLQDRVGNIYWDEQTLTREKLELQIRSYYATKEILKEKELDFVAVKCQPELSDTFVTQCLSQAFLNDPYDMDGPKEPFVCACEADLDGALTMQILKLMTGQPVLFYDLRHYDAQDGIYVFSNCGSMATFYAGRSYTPEDNLKRVSLYPQIAFYYPGGGAAVQYMASPGEVTFARLARKSGKYRMVVFRGEFVERPLEKLKEATLEWPQAFARLDIAPQTLIEALGSNHLHTVAGDYVDCLAEFCAMVGIEVVILGKQ